MKAASRRFGKPDSKTGKILQALLTALVAAVLWIGLWYLLAWKTDSELLLPSPLKVFKRLCGLAVTARFWNITAQTFLRIVKGFALGALVGTVLALISAASRFFSGILSPIGRIIKATPVASFIILALVWLKSYEIPVFISALMVTPIVWDALKTALQDTDRDLLEAAKVYRFGPLRTAGLVYIPSVRNAYLSSLLTSLGLSWKAGIAAEVLCLPKLSIGKQLYDSKVYLETLDLFAWTTAVVLLSVAMEALIKLAVKGSPGRGKAAAAVNEDGSKGLAERAADGEECVDAGHGAKVPEEAASNEVLIELRGISAGFGGKAVLSELDADIRAGNTCLVGPSGSGKTTLARILSGLHKDFDGSVSGVRGNVVYMFQEPRLLPWRSALANVASGAGSVRAFGDCAKSMLLSLGFTPEDLQKRPGELSGGMRQRVSLARAAMFFAHHPANSSVRPNLVILDEPLKGLDPATRANAVDFIYRSFSGTALLIITHSDRDLADFPGETLAFPRLPL